MADKEAEVKETLSPTGLVLFEGELWKAVSDEGEIKMIKIRLTNEKCRVEGFFIAKMRR